MKTPRIVNAVGNIDDDLIVGATGNIKIIKKKPWLKWGSFAACLAVIMLAGALIIPKLNSGGITFIGGIERNYKNITISGGESDVEWPWEYKIIYEKYPTINFKGKDYLTRIRTIKADLLGEVLGTCEAEGYDYYEEKKHTETFEVRKIEGVSEDRLVAIGMDENFYVYMRDDNTKPATFGEMLDVYGLPHNLEFGSFTRYEGFDEKGNFNVNDDEYIWQILSECRNAELFEDSDSWKRTGKNYLSFASTSEALGMYKKVFYVTEDGYIWTNIFNVAHIYFIGEDSAAKIINYAMNNSTETEAEPYEYTLAGTLTEIGDRYILIDDSVLCTDEDDGMVFKVLTDDLRIRRCLECLNIEVGDTVVVKFTGNIEVDNGNTVAGAYTMYEGKIIDGNVAVPE